MFIISCFVEEARGETRNKPYGVRHPILGTLDPETGNEGCMTEEWRGELLVREPPWCLGEGGEFKPLVLGVGCSVSFRLDAYSSGECPRDIGALLSVTVNFVFRTAISYAQCVRFSGQEDKM